MVKLRLLLSKTPMLVFLDTLWVIFQSPNLNDLEKEVGEA